MIYVFYADFRNNTVRKGIIDDTSLPYSYRLILFNPYFQVPDSDTYNYIPFCFESEEEANNILNKYNELCNTFEDIITSCDYTRYVNLNHNDYSNIREIFVNRIIQEAINSFKSSISITNRIFSKLNYIPYSPDNMKEAWYIQFTPTAKLIRVTVIKKPLSYWDHHWDHPDDENIKFVYFMNDEKPDEINFIKSYSQCKDMICYDKEEAERVLENYKKYIDSLQEVCPNYFRSLDNKTYMV